jgi:hypothetical protein
MATQRGYKVRSYVNGSTKKGKEYRNYMITVPTDIAEALPDNLTFIPKMTDEGLLYAPVTQSNSAIELPAWARSDEEAA